MLTAALKQIISSSRTICSGTNQSVVLSVLPVHALRMQSSTLQQADLKLAAVAASQKWVWQ